MTVVRLEARPPFDGAAILDFLAARAVPGVESVVGSVYERAGVSVTVGDDGIEAAVEPGVDREAAATRIRRLFDLDANAAAIDAALAGDPAMAPLVEATPGVRVPGAWDGFEVAVRAVVGQQVTVAAARTLLGRIVARCDGSGFPDAAAIVAADLDRLGMPGARVRTLRSLAEAVVRGEISFDGSIRRDDTVAALLNVRGIGPWTASYIAMRALGDSDAFPVADVGVRAGAARLGLPVEPAALLARAETWRPWRSYATVRLWRSLG